jgi:uncharacterized protein (TIGR02284 family)
MNTPSASTRATSALLNGLIVACHDDIRAHDATARLVTGERQRRLEDATHIREAFVEELGRLVRELGGTPSQAGSPLELVREWLQSARARLVGDHVGDRYSLCARVEAKTVALYERVLVRDLPDSVRLVVERQHAAVSSDRDELRRRSIL